MFVKRIRRPHHAICGHIGKRRLLQIYYSRNIGFSYIPYCDFIRNTIITNFPYLYQFPIYSNYYLYWLFIISNAFFNKQSFFMELDNTMCCICIGTIINNYNNYNNNNHVQCSRKDLPSEIYNGIFQPFFMHSYS